MAQQTRHAHDMHTTCTRHAHDMHPERATETWSEKTRSKRRGTEEETCCRNSQSGVPMGGGIHELPRSALGLGSVFRAQNCGSNSPPFAAPASSIPVANKRYLCLSLSLFLALSLSLTHTRTHARTHTHTQHTVRMHLALAFALPCHEGKP